MMNTWKKTVLMLQPSKFQASIWQTALSSQNICVMWQVAHTGNIEFINHLEGAKLKPDLLLIDLKIKNVYQLCRWARQHHPDLKILLTSDKTNEVPSALRRWSVNQGADELLASFQQQNLASDVVKKVRRVLKILDCPPPDEATLIATMFFLEQNLFVAPEKVAQEQELKLTNSISLPSKSNSPIEKDNKLLPASISDPEGLNTATIDKTVFPITRFSQSFLILTLLITTFLFDLGMLFFIIPGQKLSSKASVPTEDQTKSTKSISYKPATFQDVTNIPRGVFNYGGSTSWSPIQDITNSQIEKEHPEIDLRYVNAIGGKPGSGTGIKMLLNGQLDFSQSSRAIKQEEYLIAQERGFRLKQHPVAIDAIAIAVNPSLSVSGLTLDQLEQIYLGKITNWKEVGGPDLPIVPFSRRAEDSGTVDFFQQHVLAGEPFGANVKSVDSTTDGIRQVSNVAGGIYYSSAPEIVHQCTIKSLSLADNDGKFISPYREPMIPPESCPQKRNQLNVAAIKNATYPLTRNLFTITKQDGERSEQIGEAYTKMMLSDEGQQLIEKAGFVPLR